MCTYIQTYILLEYLKNGKNLIEFGNQQLLFAGLVANMMFGVLRMLILLCYDFVYSVLEHRLLCWNMDSAVLEH